jgi:hypothetical protein
MPTISATVTSPGGSTLASGSWSVVGNGTTSDRAAFASFNTWTLTNQGTRAADNLVTLFHDTPSLNYNWTNAGLYIAKGIYKFLCEGNGSTWNNGGDATFPGWFLGGDAQQNISGTQNFGSKFATVGKGSTTLRITEMSKIALYQVGLYMIVCGYDMQGLWFYSYGDPSNPAFHDFVQITAVDTSTGVVTFTPALTNTYYDTWPEITLYDPGIPHAYVLKDNWNTEVEYRSLTLNQVPGTKANGLKATFRNIICPTGTAGLYATVNGQFFVYNSTGATCLMESDKLIDLIHMEDFTWGTLQFQSSSIKQVRLKNGTLNTKIQGTPRDIIIDNVATADFRPGSSGYGSTEKITIINSPLLGTTTFTPDANTAIKGVNDVGLNNCYTMVNGTIIIPNGQLVSDCTDNGSGKVRLTVPTTAAFITGKTMRIQGVTLGANFTGSLASGVLTATGVIGTIDVGDAIVAASGMSGTPTISSQLTGTAGLDGTYQTNGSQTLGSRAMACGNAPIATAAYPITVVDGTHVDLPTLTFPGGSYVALNQIEAGILHPDNPLRWLIPGRNMYWRGAQEYAGGFFIKRVYQDALNIYGETSWTRSTGFPGVDLTGGKLYINMHVAPIWNIQGTFGHRELTEMSQAAPGKPPWSQYNESFDGSYIQFDGASGRPAKSPRIFGRFVSMTVNVVTPYTGGGAMTFHPFSNLVTYGYDAAMTKATWSPQINAKTAGTRIITPAGITGSTGTGITNGVATGDSGLQPGDVDLSGAPSTYPRYSVDPAGAANVAITVEIKTDQGVFRREVAPLRMRCAV